MLKNEEITITPKYELKIGDSLPKLLTKVELAEIRSQIDGLIGKDFEEYFKEPVDNTLPKESEEDWSPSFSEFCKIVRERLSNVTASDEEMARLYDKLMEHNVVNEYIENLDMSFNNYDSKYNASNCLHYAFHFYNSKQGDEFWQRIDRELA